MMDLKLRPGTPEDADACGRIAYEAFAAIAERHGFPPDLPSPEIGVGLVAPMLESPDFYAVVAEADRRVVGSNFLDERSTVYGVGPITVDPSVQDRGVGRALMEDVMRRGVERSAPGVRLLQAGYHARSLSLYAKLGFAVRELLACMTGDPPRGKVPGYDTRPATPADLEACNAVCMRVH
jgi:predicted N-acetyltransferase YhbS